MDKPSLSSRQVLAVLTDTKQPAETTLSQLRQLATDSIAHYEMSISVLTQACASFLTVHRFKPHELVRWKAQLRNRKKPEYGEPAIVIEHLVEPLYAERDPGTPYFNEPLDLILGFIDDDGDFVNYYFDSRRFEQYER